MTLIAESSEGLSYNKILDIDEHVKNMSFEGDNRAWLIDENSPVYQEGLVKNILLTKALETFYVLKDGLVVDRTSEQKILIEEMADKAIVSIESWLEDTRLDYKEWLVTIGEMLKKNDDLPLLKAKGLAGLSASDLREMYDDLVHPLDAYGKIIGRVAADTSSGGGFC